MREPTIPLSSCLPGEQLARLVLQPELPVPSHVLDCFRCLRRLEELRGLRDALASGSGLRTPGRLGRVHEPGLAPPQGRRRSIGSPTLLIAAAVLVVGSLAAWLPRLIVPIPEARVGTSLRGTPSKIEADVRWSRDGASLEVSWVPVEGADDYTLRLWRPDGELAREIRTTGTQVALGKLPETLAPEGWFLTVDAWRGSDRIASSDLHDAPAVPRR